MVEAKIIHVSVFDAHPKLVGEISKIIGEVKTKYKKLEDYEFFVTNEKVGLSDIQNLIKQLENLYEKVKGEKSG